MADWRDEYNQDEENAGSDDALEETFGREGTPTGDIEDNAGNLFCYHCKSPGWLAIFTCPNCGEERAVCKACSLETQGCVYHPNDHLCRSCVTTCAACDSSACAGCVGECATTGKIAHIGCIKPCQVCRKKSMIKTMKRCTQCKKQICGPCCIELDNEILCLSCAPNVS